MRLHIDVLLKGIRKTNLLLCLESRVLEKQSVQNMQ